MAIGNKREKLLLREGELVNYPWIAHLFLCSIIKSLSNFCVGPETYVVGIAKMNKTLSLPSGSTNFSCKDKPINKVRWEAHFQRAECSQRRKEVTQGIVARREDIAHTYAHSHTHVHTHMHTQSHTRTQTRTHSHIYTYTITHTCTQSCTHTDTYVHIRNTAIHM
jgi:hypothetical protein